MTLHYSGIYQKSTASRWPECLQFKIFSALAMIRTNEEAEAVSILHSCISQDPEGIVVKKMLGEEHEFLSLWQTDQFIDLDIQIPSSIAVAFEMEFTSRG